MLNVYCRIDLSNLLGEGYSVKEVMETMKKVTNTDFKVDIAPRRKGDPSALIADNSKLTIGNLKSFGWTPKYEDLNLICQSAYEWEMVDGDLCSR